jgi:DUF971 family protein
MQIIRFKQVSPEEVQVSWDDGHAGPMSLHSLRDACPCASCQGETVLLRRAEGLPQDLSAPGRYTLSGASVVGNYAMQFTWGDGHGEGIYTWETLRALCECPECLARRGGRTRAAG